MAKNDTKKIRVAELFAGVGGFRLGLEGKDSSGDYRVVWSNQWEPSTKKQHASEVYEARFGKDSHSNEDIARVPAIKIPDHDLLVGGFPCQDYSVARTLSQAQGLAGKKGVLWWEIHRILKEKGSKAPKFLMLENVDRLPKSPASQRGRDFAVMLASLSDLGYAVEWRVINAAEYGMPQRRKRIYILAYKNGTLIQKNMNKFESSAWLTKNGLIAEAFPVSVVTNTKSFELVGELSDITKEFNKGGGDSPFENAGMMVKRMVHTMKTKPEYKGKKKTLGDVLIAESKVPAEYYVTTKALEDWKYLKGAKKEERTTKTGFKYNYSEGGMIFPDPLDKPSRTIITAEGGSTPSRFKHLIKTKEGKFRRLTPVELERLCMFPDEHTRGVPDARRAFFMGNALVVGVIERLGKILSSRIR
jgi:DNA (cytosine-5)-methyltransferase 1